MKQSVIVWDKPIEVEVLQGPDSRWSAVGTYLGKRFECKGVDAEAAVALWQKTAGNRGV
jgi:hypothetical protein